MSGHVAAEQITKTESGLTYEVLKEGTGDLPQKGDMVVVHYTGTLADGTKFDSSRDRGKAFEFILGVGQVIKGWDEGIATMKVGERRKFTIPAALGYGTRGSPPIIPSDAILLFDVEFLGINAQ